MTSSLIHGKLFRLKFYFKQINSDLVKRIRQQVATTRKLTEKELKYLVFKGVETNLPYSTSKRGKRNLESKVSMLSGGNRNCDQQLTDLKPPLIRLPSSSLFTRRASLKSPSLTFSCVLKSRCPRCGDTTTPLEGLEWVVHPWYWTPRTVSVRCRIRVVGWWTDERRRGSTVDERRTSGDGGQKYSYVSLSVWLLVLSREREGW